MTREELLDFELWAGEKIEREMRHCTEKEIQDEIQEDTTSMEEKLEILTSPKEQ